MCLILATSKVYPVSSKILNENYFVCVALLCVTVRTCILVSNDIDMTLKHLNYLSCLGVKIFEWIIWN